MFVPRSPINNARRLNEKSARGTDLTAQTGIIRLSQTMCIMAWFAYLPSWTFV